MSDCKQDCGEKRKLPLHELSVVKKCFAVVGGKGGVGKSAVTEMLAVTMQRFGKNAAVLDADLTGPSIPRAFGLCGRRVDGTDEGIYPIITKTGIQVMSMDFLLENPGDPIVWRGPVLASYVGQFWRKVVWTDVDCMFVDMPPGTADIPLTVFESLPLDGIVVVTEPQELVESVVAKAVVMAKKLNVPIVAAVENQAYFICPDCGAKQYPYGKTDARKIAEKFGAEFYAEIPVDKNIAAQTDRGLIELFEGEYLDAVCEGLQKL